MRACADCILASIVSRSDFRFRISFCTERREDFAESASVRAVRDCVLVRVDRGSFEQLLREVPDFGLALTRVLARQLRLSCRRKRARLLVANMHPLDPLGSPDRIHQGVQAIPNHTIDPLHTGLAQHFYELLSNARFAHGRTVVTLPGRDTCPNEPSLLSENANEGSTRLADARRANT